jgi:Domain of unknown function (DUF362)
MRTLLICHDDARLDREGLVRWLGSFSNVAGTLVIREPGGRRRKRIVREIKRVGLWRFFDVLAFRAYHAVIAPGARVLVEADVVINLPKLKTHKKAGVTCALKNLVGINGNKEYLPHHRVGGAAARGDCCPSRSHVKRALEYIADRRNQTTSPAAALSLFGATLALTRILKLRGDRLGFEGSWSGNDTIWRTCLDLNRILLYGRANGSMADVPQRRVIHLVDAVVAGHGDGPLSPQPLPLGVVMGGNNATAVDWTAAQLLGYDVRKIPIVREAFAGFRWPLAPLAPADVRFAGDLVPPDAGADALSARARAAGIQYPIGWRDTAAQPASMQTAA